MVPGAGTRSTEGRGLGSADPKGRLRERNHEVRRELKLGWSWRERYFGTRRQNAEGKVEFTDGIGGCDGIGGNDTERQDANETLNSAIKDRIEENGERWNAGEKLKLDGIGGLNAVERGQEPESAGSRS
jgi:hypothetical protein